MTDYSKSGGSRDSALDCRTCGACCLANNDDEEHDDEEPFVDLLDADVRRLSAGYRRRLVGDPLIGQRLPVIVDGDTRCAALAGTVGSRVSCRIYARRPWVCRSFEVGSARCHQERREAGLE